MACVKVASLFRTVFLAVVLLLVAASPPAPATWYSAGTFEPDTRYDVGWMFERAHASASGPSQVYFNAYHANLGTSINANVGLIGSRMSSATALQWNVLLGVWRDCNADAYIGLAESALLEYPADLLLSEDICPAVPGIQEPAHNDGVWVHEFLWLGPIDASYDFTPGENAPNVIDIDGAQVWIDGLRPGQPRPPGTGGCVGAPLPAGTLSGTGGMIRYVDCILRILTGTGIAHTVNRLDPDGALGLRFEEPNDPSRSSSRLNVFLPVPLFNNPYTGQRGILELDSGGDSSFTTWDCSSRAAEVQVPAGGPVVWVATPDPRVGDLRDSHADALNETARGTSLTGDCTTTGRNTFGEYYSFVDFLGDGPVTSSSQQKGKDQSDVGVFFIDGVETPSEMRTIFGERAPVSLGVNGPVRWNWGPGWFGDFTSVTLPTQTFRDNLLSGQFAGGRYYSAYAGLGPEVHDKGFLMPTAGTGRYGSESCGEFATGIRNGWECDPLKWYRSPNGANIATRWDVRVQTEYSLRDVDCLDNEVVRGTSIYLSPVYFSPDGACEGPP